MEIGIILDELSHLHPVILKSVSPNTVISHVLYYTADGQPDPTALYLAPSAETGSMSLFPRHLILTGAEEVSPH
ncbi:MAG: hypothetical protein AAGU16_14220, partial [Desulfitobacterium hafniense]